MQGSYGPCKTEIKQCDSCIPTTKLVTRSNYNNKIFKNMIETNNNLLIINVTVDSSRLMITLPGLALYVAKLALAQSMGYSY